ncbi:MAG: Fic family protein [Gammaproteobacteria bacterium]
MEDENRIGGSWLVARYDMALVMPLTVASRVGGRRTTQHIDGITTETFVEAMRPDATLRGHLTFHLKHEVPHLELLARLFDRIDPAELTDWIHEAPASQYARRSGFLYEWLTGRQLELRKTINGAYVDVLDDRKVIAASLDQRLPNRRWRVRDNLPGTPACCPVVRKTPDLLGAMDVDIRDLLRDLESEFGADLLMRSAFWMTLRESRSSFAIEGEADQSERIARFADVLARRTGQGQLPIDNATLAELQMDILGQRTSLREFGIRRSPVFVGSIVRHQEWVHYVAPPAEQVTAMLSGLATFWARTQGQSPIVRSAVLAFAFVYIHPLADGNGRLHRFLVNDALRRDGVLKDPMLLPVSSLITSAPTERRAYDLILETVSRPLMRALTGTFAFLPNSTTYPDGIRSNLAFEGHAIAQPVWRFPDLTRHVVYLADVLQRTVRDDMRAESRYLQQHARARTAIKDIVEMPDSQIDRVIRSITAHQGVLSNTLAAEMPVLSESGVWAAVVDAVARAFDGSLR